ncbi:MAG: tetratricopeptide repeat protein [Bacteroidota bacterium]
MKQLLYFSFFILLFSNCQQGPKVEDAIVHLADSLSLRLNSPELKAVNAELLKDASNADLYNKRAQIYLSLKQLNEAGNDAKRAILIDSSKANYYLTMVDVYYAQNNTRLAKDLLVLTGTKFPENTETLLKLSELYFLVRQYQMGIDYVNKALKIDERIAKAYYIKGSIYRESGDTAKAISSLETAVEQDNRFIDAFYDLGILYAARKNPIAFDYYKNVLQINPNHFDARYARAKLMQDLGKIDDAITEYQALLKINVACEICHYNLGALFLEFKKDNLKALEEFTKAIQIKPDYIEAYFARAYTYTKLKDKLSAKADYQMCLKIQPDYDAAAEALNGL